MVVHYTLCHRVVRVSECKSVIANRPAAREKITKLNRSVGRVLEFPQMCPQIGKNL